MVATIHSNHDFWYFQLRTEFAGLRRGEVEPLILSNKSFITTYAKELLVGKPTPVGSQHNSKPKNSQSAGRYKSSSGDFARNLRQKQAPRFAGDCRSEPWRFHLLWHEQCRKIAANFFEWFDGDIKPSTKIPAMLSASGALIIVNWLPQEGLAKSEKSTLINEEHLAATAAAVQNLLLLLTAHGMGTYWSSGGQFRSEAMFSRMGISPVERLLAAVFVEFPETMNLDMERLPGKQRKNRTSVDNWLNVVEIE